jgi:hypothetical protein
MRILHAVSNKYIAHKLCEAWAIYLLDTASQESVSCLFYMGLFYRNFNFRDGLKSRIKIEKMV